MSQLIKKISRIKPVVKRILTNYPETRDNDKLLILKVWAEQNPELRNPSYRFLQFAGDFLENNYIDPESIRRSRQKLQEESPELRGKLYEERHKEGSKTRKDINNGNG